MSKTREITFDCEEVRTQSKGYRLEVVINEPNTDQLLSCIDEKDIISYIVSERNKPEDVFNEEALEKWAEENGYTKQ
jgi:hypothetical protein